MISKVPTFLRFLIILVIALGIDIYTYQAVKTISKDFHSNLLRTSVRRAYWLSTLFFLVYTTSVMIFATLQPIKESSPLYQYVFAFFILLYAPKLIIIPILLFEDLFRLGKLIVKKYLYANKKPDVSNKINPITRKQFISQSGLVLASIPFLGILHGITVGRYNFQVFHHDLSFKDLPISFSGLKIVQISDIHAGSFNNREAVAKGVDLILAQKPDIIFFTGDLVNNLAEEMLEWKTLFARLNAPLGIYSIVGNHDYGDYVSWESLEAKLANFLQLQQIHKEMGWHLLMNDAHIIHKNGAEMAIVGVENWGNPPFPQYGDLTKALTKVHSDMFIILLSHDPTHWDEIVLPYPQKVHLTLSGHTHGMQFGVELGNIRWSPVSFKYPRWAGLYEESNQFLHVNRGFGTIGFPGRVGIFPEITVITLHSKNQSS
jgi:predicted MPP superfamily phosphohydrolase